MSLDDRPKLAGDEHSSEAPAGRVGVDEFEPGEEAVVGDNISPEEGETGADLVEWNDYRQ